jgi:hypothetical protein
MENGAGTPRAGREVGGRGTVAHVAAGQDAT